MKYILTKIMTIAMAVSLLFSHLLLTGSSSVSVSSQEHQSKINCSDNFEDSVLLEAVKMDSTELILCYIRKGADVDYQDYKYTNKYCEFYLS
jgi:hypothetical protein